MKNLYNIKNELYIISINEDINENDYIITKDGRLVQVSYLLSKDVQNGHKVILTTNNLLINDGVQPIEDYFLEWFVKNPSCEEVEVGYGWIRLTETNNEGYWISIPDNKLELKIEELKQEYVKCTCANSLEYSNCGKKCERILDEQEPKQETIEETYLNQLIDEANKEFTLDRKLAKDVAVKYANWQAERMYSEEDVKSFGQFCADYNYKCFGKKTQEEMLQIWSEQFKK